jgi:ribosomal protein S18 acetylase RimI-like enzyme
MSARSVRIVVADDPVSLERVRHLLRAYSDEFASLIGESLSLQGFEAELASLPGRYAPPSGCLLLALDGDRACGCVALRDLGSGTCEMKRLYVAPNSRRAGVGRLLVAAILKHAAAAGYRRMVLDTLFEMTEAVALYRSFGFSDTDRYWDNPVAHTVYLEKTLV